MIAKFVDSMKKIAVLKDRPELGKHNIGVANDLTKRQRQTLSQLRSENKRGFYKNGRLVVEDLAPSESPEVTKSPPSAERTDERGSHALSGTSTHDRDRVLRSMSKVKSTSRK
ncbi:uncharacterized protein LOC124288544 [Haliotis rubra]|uniref:uncharacterized protein LOC124288544 n=1 Tax=Haliotis rubra TaxID=36100 RepID=UPI001EE5041A|nr:uncharacterized protein LOC124288544 [Haliotis rubra]